MVVIAPTVHPDARRRRRTRLIAREPKAAAPDRARSMLPAMSIRRLLSLALLAAFACGGPKPKPDPMGPITTGAPGGGSAAPAKPDPDALALWPKVKRGVLPNGLTYYVLKHGKP